jgi:YD repeat-containing protein
VTVTKAYRDSGGTLQSGSVIEENTYDGLGRRIFGEVEHSADLDCTYHNYYSASWQFIETRDGSDEVLKQHVWGLTYIDELVQVGFNDDPTDDNEGDGTQSLCETFYYACQDANFNVLGIVDADGALTERYDYTSYGQRATRASPVIGQPERTPCRLYHRLHRREAIPVQA